MTHNPINIDYHRIIQSCVKCTNGIGHSVDLTAYAAAAKPDLSQHRPPSAMITFLSRIHPSTRHDENLHIMVMM